MQVWPEKTNGTRDKTHLCQFRRVVPMARWMLDPFGSQLLPWLSQHPSCLSWLTRGPKCGGACPALSPLGPPH